jgi:hypothetical protein
MYYDHIEDTGSHRASEDQTGDGDRLSLWQISFETLSNSWYFVALLKLLLNNVFNIL